MFSVHPLAECRLGTIVSRYKDCTVLISYASLCNTLDIEAEDLAVWLWTKTTSKNYINLMKNEEEINEQYSYMPYFMEMSLAQRSPYSAATNPDLHFLLHGVGTFLGLIRSRNAKIVGTPNITDTLSNSLVIAHAFNKISKLSHQWDIDGESIDFEENAIVYDEEKEIYERMPKDLLPQSWLRWLHEADYMIPDYIKRPLAKTIRALDEQRAGTVGRFIREFVIAWANLDDDDE